MSELFLGDGSIIDTNLMVTHYKTGIGIVSCGCKDQIYRYSDDLSKVDCEICMEIEMDRCADAEERQREERAGCAQPWQRKPLPHWR